MSQLVRTAGGFGTTSDAFKFLDDILSLHATHQLRDSNGIAWTTSIEMNGVDDASCIINIQFYRFRASALRFVNSLHAYFMLV